MAFPLFLGVRIATAREVGRLDVGSFMRLIHCFGVGVGVAGIWGYYWGHGIGVLENGATCIYTPSH
jgi:hypothetical protein